MKRRRRKIDEKMQAYDEFPVEKEGGEPALQVADPDRGPMETLINKELQDHLDRAILRLPMEYRVVFILRDLEGNSNEETAAILGISQEATKSRLRRARSFLRLQLHDYLAD